MALITCSERCPAISCNEGKGASLGLRCFTALAYLLRDDRTSRSLRQAENSQEVHYVKALAQASPHAGGMRTALLGVCHYQPKWKTWAKSCQMQQPKYNLGIHGAAPMMNPNLSSPYVAPLKMSGSHCRVLLGQQNQMFYTHSSGFCSNFWQSKLSIHSPRLQWQSMPGEREKLWCLEVSNRQLLLLRCPTSLPGCLFQIGLRIMCIYPKFPNNPLSLFVSVQETPSRVTACWLYSTGMMRWAPPGDLEGIAELWWM